MFSVLLHSESYVCNLYISSDVCPKIFNIEKYKIVDNLNGEATVTLLIAHLIKQKKFISKNPTLLFKKRLSWSCISVLGFKKKDFFFWLGLA